MLSFYSWYSYKFLQLPPRLRNKKLAAIQVGLLKNIGLLVIFGSNAVILAYGKFENEFLRVSIGVAVGMFLYYSDVHYAIRLTVSVYSNLIKFRACFSMHSSLFTSSTGTCVSHYCSAHVLLKECAKEVRASSNYSL